MPWRLSLDVSYAQWFVLTPFFHYFPFQLFDDMPDITLLRSLVRGPRVDECAEAGLLSREGCEDGKIYIHHPVDGEKTPSFMVPEIRYILSRDLL